ARCRPPCPPTCTPPPPRPSMRTATSCLATGKPRRPTMNKKTTLLALALATTFAAANASAANLFLVNQDTGSGAGLDDPTPKAPEGGNPGTTLGEQRRLVYQYAARMWGSMLDSDVPVYIGARFIPQTCTPTSAVLGSAGTTNVFRDFPG